MWEWRAFGPAALLSPPERTRREPVSRDERTDLYLLLGDRESSHDDLGLKVRGVLVSEKCELKRRYERDASGVELWEKVFEKKLPLDPLWFRELAGFLEVDRRRPKSAREDERLPSLATRADVERLCVEVGLGRPRLVSVKKTIAKAPFPPAFTIESCELEIAAPGRAPIHVRSIALEAPTLELCLEIGDELSLPRACAPGLDSRITVAGYPFALTKLVEVNHP